MLYESPYVLPDVLDLETPLVVRETSGYLLDGGLVLVRPLNLDFSSGEGPLVSEAAYRLTKASKTRLGSGTVVHDAQESLDFMLSPECIQSVSDR